MVIVEVPAEKVKPVVVARFQLEQLIVDEPSVIDRVLELFEIKPVVAPTLKLPVLNDPFVNVIELDDVLSALVSVQPPPTPSNTTGPPKVMLLVLIVLPVVVALNVIGPVLFHTVPAINDMDPLTASVGPVPELNVTVPAETVRSRQVNPFVMVTV